MKKTDRHNGLKSVGTRRGVVQNIAKETATPDQLLHAQSSPRSLEFELLPPQQQTQTLASPKAASVQMAPTTQTNTQLIAFGHVPVLLLQQQQQDTAAATAWQQRRQQSSSNPWLSFQLVTSTRVAAAPFARLAAHSHAAPQELFLLSRWVRHGCRAAALPAPSHQLYCLQF